MLMRHAFANRAVRAAAGLLLLSVILTTFALARAVQLDPLPAPTNEAPIVTVALHGSARTPNNLLEGAVAAAPFTSAREPLTSRLEPSPPMSNAQQLQLVGTVVDSDGDSFVLVSATGGPARVVRVNETIAGYRLRSISQGSAVFSRMTDGERVELRVPRSR
jgi:hypothetical protein